MSKRPTQVTDDGSLRRYRTEIPNTVIRGIHSLGLSVHAKWLYVYLKSIAGDSGACWQSMRTISLGSSLTLGTLSRARRELVNAKLIKIETGDKARHYSDCIRITDIWLDNMLEFSSSTEERGRDEVEIEGTPLFESRVPGGNTPRSTGEPDRVPQTDLARSTDDTQEDPSLRRSQDKNKDSNANALLRRAVKQPTALRWPDDDLWLLTFLRTQEVLTLVTLPLEHKWWDSVSIACSGVSEQFLKVEFAKIESWLIENPNRKPTPKGAKRFIRTWLERAHERERRFRNGKT